MIIKKIEFSRNAWKTLTDILAFCGFSFGPDIAFGEFSFGPDIITDPPGCVGWWEVGLSV